MDGLLIKLLDLVSWLSSLFRAVWTWLLRLVVVRWGLLASWRFALFAPHVCGSPYFFQIIGTEISARLLRFLYLTHDTPDVFSLKELVREVAPAQTKLDAFVRFEQLPWAEDDDVIAIASFALPENADDSTVVFRQLIVDPQKQLELQPVRPMRLQNLFSVQMGDLIQAAVEPPRRVDSDQLAKRLAALERIQEAGFDFAAPLKAPEQTETDEARGAAHTSS